MSQPLFSCESLRNYRGLLMFQFAGRAAAYFSASLRSEASLRLVFAGVAELVDALDLGSSGEIRGGSSPPFRMLQKVQTIRAASLS